MIKKYPDLAKGGNRAETYSHMVIQQSVKLTKQSPQIQNELFDINPLNAKKKKDNVLAMLQKWFPAMENFEEQLKKYQSTIRKLSDENIDLLTKVDEIKENKIKNQLEKGKLQSEIQDLRHFKEFIPEDIWQELANRSKQRKEKGWDSQNIAQIRTHHQQEQPVVCGSDFHSMAGVEGFEPS